MWKLWSGVTRLTGVINSLLCAKARQNTGRTTWLLTGYERAQRVFFDVFTSKTAKTQRNQTELLSETTKLKQKAASSEQTMKINVSSLFMCVLSDRAIAFWTKSCVPGVACEDKYFFTMVRLGTSPPRGPPLPCEQALTILFARLHNFFCPLQKSTVPRKEIRERDCTLSHAATVLPLTSRTSSTLSIFTETFLLKKAFNLQIIAFSFHYCKVLLNMNIFIVLAP